jgi:hypothetical protein
MSYNIRRNTRTKTQTIEWPTGDRPAEKHFESVEDITVCGTDDVLTFLIKLCEQHNVSCSRLKTCVKYKTSTKKYEDIAKQLGEKFPQTLMEKVRTQLRVTPAWTGEK